MRLLYLSQYFPPEIGATQTRALEMAKGLVAAGHQVTMIAEFPCHPSGVMPDEYKGKFVEHTQIDGIEVIRVWVKASPRKSFARRMLFYLSYMFMAILAGAFLTTGEYSLVYATSPPLFVGAAGVVISILKRGPFVFEVRDLWPESAVQMGELSNKYAIKLAEWLERACYRRACGIVVVSEGIAQFLLEKGYGREKIQIIPNGANTRLYTPQKPDKEIYDEIGVNSDDFIAIYIGLFGLIHQLETVLEAASLLSDQQDISFVLLGDGPKREDLIQKANDLNLTNVHFHDLVPETDLPGYIALANVGLHAQRRLEISKMAMPVKVFSYMACGKPVVMALEGEAADMLREAEAGIVVPPESAVDMADAILRLRSDPDAAARFGSNGRSFVETYYSRQAQAEKLSDYLQRIFQQDH